MDLNALRYVPNPKPLSVAFFQDIAKHLAERIRTCVRVYGCVAWFSHPEVLAALKGRPCCIIMNREDWSQIGRHMEAYDTLTPIPTAHLLMLNPALRTLHDNYASKAVRAVGIPENGTNKPRLHHKFLILEQEGRIGIWTGSFNVTMNASMSLENAIYSEDPNLVAAYIQEFVQVLCFSSEMNDEWKPEMYFTMRPAVIELPDPTPVVIPLRPESSTDQGSRGGTETWAGTFGRIAGEVARSFNETVSKTQMKVTVVNVPGVPPAPALAAPPVTKQSPVGGLLCTVCHRNNHTADRCYAKTDLHGRPIERK